MPADPAVVIAALFALTLAGCAGDGTEPTKTGSDTGADSTDTGTPDTDTDTGTAPIDDADQDGSPDDVDCDDGDPTVFPGAPDVCGDDRITDCDRSSDDQRVTVDGAATFDDLAEALSVAGPGATVTVCRGTWTGPFVAQVPVHLVAHHGPADTVLDGDRSGTTLSVPGGSSLTGFTVTRGRVDGDGGGLAVVGSGPLTVTDCVISGNVATRGGGIAISGSVQATVADTVVSDNEAEDGGGGVAILDGASVELVGTTVSGNLGGRYGGGVFLADGTLIGGLVTGNEAPFPLPSYGQPAGGGGVAVFGTGAVVGTDIAANTASFGAGLSSAHGAVTLTDVSIHDNQLISSSGTGGGLWLSRADARLDGATEIVDNAAPGSSGGGVSITSGTLTGGLVARNSAYYQCGGVLASDATIDGVSIEENAALEMAGLCVSGPVTVLGGRIAANVASGPGGGGGPFGGSAYPAVFDGVEIADNRASVGAGLYLEQVDVTLIGCDVVRNVADQQGGGVAVVAGGTFTSQTSIWGATADDNLPDDVFADAPYAWDGEATFTCTEDGC